jgi:hypothetical protein
MNKLFFFMLLFISLSCAAKINVKKTSSMIHVGEGAGFINDGHISCFKGKLIKDTGGSISGGKISFDNGTYIDGGNQVKVTGDLNLDAVKEIVLNGKETFKGKRGSAVPKVKIKGAGNRLEGVLQLTNSIELQDASSSLTCAIQGRVSCDIALNGGLIFLEEDLYFVNDMFFTGSGVIKLNKRKVRLGGAEMTANADLYFCNAQDIEMNANLSLASTWTFSGFSVLEGNDRILCLGDGSGIVVEPNSSLLFRNIALRNVSGNKIRCLDKTSTLSFQNVRWILDKDYSFTVGAMHIINNFEISGRHVFAFQSAQTSTLCCYGKLMIDRGMTFSFDPIWNSSVIDWDQACNFLVFEDDTCSFELKGATLHVTTTGFKLKKGTFRVKEKSYIYSELDGDFHREEGFILGNNNADDDVKFEVMSGSKLELLSGALSYKNVQASSCEMLGSTSRLFVKTGGKLKLHQDLDVGEGSVSFMGGSTLARASGKKLSGNIHLQGSIYYGRCYN